MKTKLCVGGRVFVFLCSLAFYSPGDKKKKKTVASLSTPQLQKNENIKTLVHLQIIFINPCSIN